MINSGPQIHEGLDGRAQRVLGLDLGAGRGFQSSSTRSPSSIYSVENVKFYLNQIFQKIGKLFKNN